MYFMPFMEYWVRVQCPGCLTSNWVYLSHSGRAYPELIDAARCRDCKAVLYLESEEEFRLRHGAAATETDLSPEEGRASP